MNRPRMLQDKVEQYQRLRTESPPLPRQIGAFVSSDAFKFRRQASELAERWDAYLSAESGHRSSTSFKSSARVPLGQQIISLGVGRPQACNMPWPSMTMNSKARCGRTAANDISRFNCRGKRDDVISDQTPIEMFCSVDEEAYDLGLALNYSSCAGSPNLLRFITEHTEMIHDPPYADWETSLTCGSTAAIEMVFRIFCDPGDWILTEELTYPNTLAATQPLGIKALGIVMDDEGLVPDDLDSKLLSWRSWIPEATAKPRLLYTVPSGHNPTGKTQSAGRRRAIYGVAEKHGLIIVEDDPYYFLQLRQCGADSKPLDPDDFMSTLPPSYLSLDKSGRVVRLDSASKILAPGLRCGWITASAQIIAKFQSHSEYSTIAPSGPSQVMLFKLLEETWGHEGFIQWLSKLSTNYGKRLTTMAEACDRYLQIGDLCSWHLPAAGMFVWIRLDWTRHPKHSIRGFDQNAKKVYLEIEQRIYERAQAIGVQVSKGSWFDVGHVPRPEICFRLTFAAAPESELSLAVERFAQAAREEFSGSLTI